MANSRQNILSRFAERPIPLEGGLRAEVEPVDDYRAWLRIEDQGHRFDARAAVLSVPYPSGLQRLLAADPGVEAVLLEDGTRRFDKAAKEAGVGFLDLRGRGRLQGPGFVYVVPPYLPSAGISRGEDIEDDGGGDPWEARPASSSLKPRSSGRVSPFAPKASRVSRALLVEPDRSWRVSDVADRCRMNPGNAHRVLGALVERDLLERDRDGYVVLDAGSLLEAWCEEGRRPSAKDRIVIPVRDDVRGEAHDLVDSFSGEAAVSGELAAELIAPHLPSAQAIVHCFSARAWDPERLAAGRKAPPLRPQGQIVVDLVDEGVHDFGEVREGLPLVAPHQVYFDLYRDRHRAREAAEHLRREVLRY